MSEIKKYQLGRLDIFFMLVIFACAVILRILYFNDYHNTGYFPILTNSDSDAYYSWGRDISCGDIWGSRAFMKWPLYAYLLGFLFKIFGHSATLVYSLQFILGAGNCVLTYLIARILFNQKAGLIAGLLCVLYGLFIFYDGLLIYTTFSLFLNSLLLLYFLAIKDSLPAKGNLFLAGIFLGICTALQASILIFGILAVVWILASNRLKVKQFFLGLIFFFLGLVLVIGSVTLRNYLVEKDFVLIAGNIGFNFYSGNNTETQGTFFCPKDIGFNQEDMFRDAKITARMDLGRDLKTSEVSKYWFDKAMVFIKREPLNFIKLFQI